MIRVAFGLATKSGLPVRRDSTTWAGLSREHVNLRLPLHRSIDKADVAAFRPDGVGFQSRVKPAVDSTFPAVWGGGDRRADSPFLDNIPRHFQVGIVGHVLR